MQTDAIIANKSETNLVKGLCHHSDALSIQQESILRDEGFRDAIIVERIEAHDNKIVSNKMEHSPTRTTSKGKAVHPATSPRTTTQPSKRTEHDRFSEKVDLEEMRKRQEAIALGKKARQDRVLSSPIHEAEPTPSDLAAFSSSPQGARPAKSSISALPGFPIGCVSMHFPEHSAPTQSEEPTTEQSTSIPAQSGFPIGCVSMHFPEHSASTQSEQPTTEQSRSPPRPACCYDQA